MVAMTLPREAGTVCGGFGLAAERDPLVADDLRDLVVAQRAALPVPKAGITLLAGTGMLSRADGLAHVRRPAGVDPR